MPYKSDQKGLLIPRELKRSTKLSEEDKLEILNVRRYGTSYQKIAYLFGVSKKRIMQICKPEIEERDKKRFKEQQKEGRFYDKEKHRNYMKKHRKYKHTLMDEGLLKDKTKI